MLQRGAGNVRLNQNGDAMTDLSPLFAANADYAATFDHPGW